MLSMLFPFYPRTSRIAPVTKRFNNDTGSITFQPKAISWSYRGRGSDARRRMNMQINTNIFIKNQTMPGSTRPEPAAEK